MLAVPPGADGLDLAGVARPAQDLLIRTQSLGADDEGDQARDILDGKEGDGHAAVSARAGIGGMDVGGKGNAGFALELRGAEGDRLLGAGRVAAAGRAEQGVEGGPVLLRPVAGGGLAEDEIDQPGQGHRALPPIPQNWKSQLVISNSPSPSGTVETRRGVRYPC